MRVINHQNGDRCKKNEVAISWNEKGAKGDAGPAGPAGPKGDPGAALGYALVVFDETTGEPKLDADQSKNVNGVDRGFTFSASNGVICFDLAFTAHHATGALQLDGATSEGPVSLLFDIPPYGNPEQNCPAGFRDAIAYTLGEEPQDAPFYVAFN